MQASSGDIDVKNRLTVMGAGEEGEGGTNGESTHTISAVKQLNRSDVHWAGWKGFCEELKCKNKKPGMWNAGRRSTPEGMERQ